MSDAVQLAVVAGFITIATLVIKGKIAALAEKAKVVAAAEAAKVTQKLEAVEIKIDGRLTQLLEITKKAYLAEGIAEEKERHKSEEQNKAAEVPPLSGTTNLKIVEGDLKVKTETKKK